MVRIKLLSLPCLVSMLLTPLALAQKPVKKYPTSTITQKNKDGTVSTITTDGHGFNEKETRDQNHAVIDRITTKPDNTYGEGGTKVEVLSRQDKPAIEGPDIKTGEIIEEYKNKSGTVRHREVTDHISPAKYSIDYGEDGKPTNFVETGLLGGKVFVRIKHDYDKSGRPLTTTVERRDDPAEALEKYRITYKYNGDDDKQGTATVEKYNELNEKWEDTKDINPDYVKYQETYISSEVARVINSTERIFDLTGDIESPLTDVGGDSKEKKEPAENHEPSNTKPPSTPSTRRDVRPRRAEPPRKVATGPAGTSGKATATNSSPTSISGGIDPCLIGVWQSQLLTYQNGAHQALLGIVLTIRADGVVTMDYNGMQAIPYWTSRGSVGGAVFSWAGTASGRIRPEEINLVMEEKADITEKITDPDPYGFTGNRPVATTELEPLGPAGLSRSYKCDATTLTQHNMTGDFTFKRAGTMPR